ncbi:Type-1 restriction enzyme EcoKI specificity protein [Nonomuraea coxensis DSM 45129]|uniref:Type-1 restriction enzyme EcoKI specificity protein n=1 Tax=Nonomuraea coxensis DSM 45129 TaxID=1122611 RepID=A0ABX8TVW0_9ACTN|nr:restriction endonuclease subunit S [Nonomuraea coxensis]QYC39084.1 Type-1 restriction enzyme EcoKI specificity protein [Nonomuraea coxensis DSM 45129]
MTYRIKDVALVNQNTLAESTDPEFRFRYIDIGSVNSIGNIDIPDEDLTFAAAPSRARRLAPPGAVIVSTVRTYLRAIASVPETSDPLVFSTGFTVLEAKECIDSRFLSYYCHSQRFIDDIVARSVGVSYPAINPSEISALPISLPRMDEQRRIADFLDAETARIDRLSTLQAEAIKRLGERDTALRDALVDALFEDVGEIPLRRLSTFIEQGTSPQCEAAPCEPGEWGILKLSAVKRGAFDPLENKRLPDDVEPARVNEVRPGDFLVTRANTPNLVGDVAVVNGVCEKLLLPDLIYRVGLTEGVIPEFVAQVAMSSRVRAFIQAVARGSSQSMVKLRGEDIRAWPIPAAAITQQEALVVRVREGTSATALLRTTMKRQLTLLAERRQALITAAVTGQFDVSSASGRGVEE